MDKFNRLIIENSVYGCNSVEAFLKLVTVDTEAQQRFLQKMQWRQANRYWLKKSVKIAVKILSELKTLKITKFDLAIAGNIPIERMNEIVKGQADMTLSEIGKIEKVLKIKL